MLPPSRRGWSVVASQKAQKIRSAAVGPGLASLSTHPLRDGLGFGDFQNFGAGGSISAAEHSRECRVE
jgi:hypothetical protein